MRVSTAPRSGDWHVTDLNGYRDDLVTAVLVAKADGRLDLGGTLEHRRHQVAIPLVDRPSAHLARARQLVVVGVELLWQHEIAVDAELLGHFAVDPRDLATE